jgi:multiple sugar transport system permease protein
VFDALKAHKTSLMNAPSTGWLFAAPATFLMFMFIVVPFALAFWFSFTNQRFVSPNAAEFIGLQNYRELLSVNVLTVQPERDRATNEILKEADGTTKYPAIRSFTRNNPDYPQYKGMREWFSWTSGDNKKVLLASDPVFMRALVNTFLFVLFVAPLQGGLALVLALMINQKLRGINIFRTIYFMPVVVSMVVVALLWRFIYDGQNGLLNTLLSGLTFGLFQPVDWLGNPSTAFPALIAMSIWQAVGFHMVIWLSGLQTIPASLYEAADIEGVTPWQKFRYVTWPGLRNTAVLVLIVITMQAFALFTQVRVMTMGGPLDSTQSVVFQAVERGYGKQDISGGSAIAVILFFIVLTVSLVQRYLTRTKT